MLSMETNAAVEFDRASACRAEAQRARGSGQRKFVPGTASGYSLAGTGGAMHDANDRGAQGPICTAASDARMGRLSDR